MAGTPGIAVELFALYARYDRLRHDSALPVANVPGAALVAGSQVARGRFSGSRAHLSDLLHRLTAHGRANPGDVQHLAGQLIGRLPKDVAIAPATLDAELIAPLIATHQRIVDLEMEMVRASLNRADRLTISSLPGQPPEVSAALHFLLPLGETLKTAYGAGENNLFPWHFVEPSVSPAAWGIQARVIDTVFRFRHLGAAAQRDAPLELLLMSQHRVWHELVLREPSAALVEKLAAHEVERLLDEVFQREPPQRLRVDSAETLALMTARQFIETSRTVADVCRRAGLPFDDSYMPAGLTVGVLGDLDEDELPAPGRSGLHDILYADVLSAAAAEARALDDHLCLGELKDLRPTSNLFLDL